MTNLLIGCKVTYDEENSKLEGVVIKVDNDDYAWILKPTGLIAMIKVYKTTVSPEDVRFIYHMSKNYKIREKVLTETTDRFEMMDL